MESWKDKWNLMGSVLVAGKTHNLCILRHDNMGVGQREELEEKLSEIFGASTIIIKSCTAQGKPFDI